VVHLISRIISVFEFLPFLLHLVASQVCDRILRHRQYSTLVSRTNLSQSTRLRVGSTSSVNL
jgi:hypothetical protein